jgi:hypothetical protein
MQTEARWPVEPARLRIVFRRTEAAWSSFLGQVGRVLPSYFRDLAQRLEMNAVPLYVFLGEIDLPSKSQCLRECGQVAAELGIRDAAGKVLLYCRINAGRKKR